jgi:hypothetical protein
VKNQIARPMRARTTVPPTTPPAIAPVLLLLGCGVDEGFGVECVDDDVFKYT